jgi:hypothetical protein
MRRRRRNGAEENYEESEQAELRRAQKNREVEQDKN